MNYGVILASGKGTRIKDNIDIPKQFRLINNVPTMIYPIKTMIDMKCFKGIFIIVPEDYIEYTNNIIREYISDNIDNIYIVPGGKERMDSINNAIQAIITDNEIKDDDVVVIHDGVRPFVTTTILKDSINGAREHGATVAAIPVADTLLISESGNIVDNIPNRSLYYKGQAPDSFRIKLFVELLSKLTEEDYKKITGTSQVCTLNNYPIHMIAGDEINFKITTASDISIAENIAKNYKGVDINE